MLWFFSDEKTLCGSNWELTDHLLVCSVLTSGTDMDENQTPSPHYGWTSEQAWQTCPIALAAAVVWKKRLITPSTTASELARWGVDSSHRTQAARAVRRWLRRRQYFISVSGWEAYGVFRDPSCSQNGYLDDAKEGMVWQCKLFTSWSGFLFKASA